MQPWWTEETSFKNLKNLNLKINYIYILFYFKSSFSSFSCLYHFITYLCLYSLKKKVLVFSFSLFSFGHFSTST